MPRAEHIAGRPASLPRQPARGGRLRGRARASAASGARSRSTASSRRARFAAGPAARGRRARSVMRTVLHNFLPRRRVRGRAARRAAAARALRRAPGGGEGARHRDRGRRARRRAAGDRRLRTGGAAPCGRWPAGSRRTSGSSGTARRRGAGRGPARGRLRVIPSRWDEPCPYSVIEAMAAGRAGARLGHGRPARMVGRRGRAARPGTPVAGRRRCSRCGATPSCGSTRAVAALARARELFGEDRFYSGLMDVYGGRGRRERGARRPPGSPTAGPARRADRAGRLRRAPWTRWTACIERRERIYVCADRRARGDGLPARLRHAGGAARARSWSPTAAARVGAQPPRGRAADRVYGPELTTRYCRRAAERWAPCLAVRRRDPGRRSAELDARARGAGIPGIEIAGGRSPPHRPLTEEEERDVAERINADGAGRRVGRDRRAQAGAVDGAHAPPASRRRCWPGVGAAFDFIAGRKRQAPRGCSGGGLEWLFRLVAGPACGWRPATCATTPRSWGLRPPVCASERVLD